MTYFKQILIIFFSLPVLLSNQSTQNKFEEISEHGKESKTNVLIITVDDMTYNSVGVFGCKIPGITPNRSIGSKPSAPLLCGYPLADFACKADKQLYC
jgi:hypothetical protein